MPSIYHSCTITDEATEALGYLKQHLEGVRQQFNTELQAVAAALNDLEGDKTFASTTIGTTVDSQVTWTAQASGRGGNAINITYIYLGPAVDGGGNLIPRQPYSEVDGNTIRLYLGSDADGTVSLSVGWHVFIWVLFNPDVAALVSAVSVGTGTDVPEASAATYLTGGKDRPVTRTEDAANQVSEVFGYKDHKDFLKAVDIPVIETAADAAAFLGEDDAYLIINGKLLIVSGTNLVGLNKLYEKTGNDLAKTKIIVGGMNTTLPTMVTTQNVTRTSMEVVCAVSQTISTVTETYRDLDTGINTSRIKWGGDLESFHHYIFWGERVSATQAAYDRLVRWNIPEDYIGEILSGESAVQEDYLEYEAPEVYKIDDLSLLTDLKFTDAELEELLQAGVSGVRIPHKVPMTTRVQAITKLLTRKPTVRDNGMRSSVKAPVAAIQTLDISKTTDDAGLAKELSTRGAACARSSARLEAGSIGGFNVPNLPNLDLPNLPSAQLPDPAKKIESAYGALSSGISFASKIFDLMVGSLTGTIGGILNKITNLSSLTDNVFGNDMAKCLLGMGSGNTGTPDIPGVGDVGGAGGGSSIPDISNILGGIPLPMSLLKEAFQSLSISLDETVTDAFETMMGTLQVPLCIIQSLLGSIGSFGGFDLGGLLNPCKEGTDTDDKCPAEEVQGVIDASPQLTASLSTIPSLEGAPTTLPEQTTTEEIENFTGSAKQTVTETTSAVTRGIQEVMDEVSQTIDSKVEMIEQFDKAIKELFGDARDINDNADEDEQAVSGCGPSVLGLFTDAISDFL